MTGSLAVIGLLALVAAASADTPANCTHADILGRWTLWETARHSGSKIPCENGTTGPWERKTRVVLQSPNIAIDQYGNRGTWTMVYNQGFYIHVNGRSYFGFSAYKMQKGGDVVSMCDRTEPALSHDDTMRHWTCFYAQKRHSVQHKYSNSLFRQNLRRNLIPREDHLRIVEEVNARNTSWTAALYEPFASLSYEELLMVRGGRKSWASRPVAPSSEFRSQNAGLASEVQQKADSLPDSWDWRDVNGINYVGPVRDQKLCGSCYAFSSVGMIESRLRIRTNNTLKPVLSPQDIVSCSSLSQGCEGGFPFLVGGRYGQDFGLVEESCEPYTGTSGECKRKKDCPRYYVSSYSYVGGYYGACSEPLMRLALVQRGPLSVSFMVTKDFMHYKGGIYRDVFKDETADPSFEVVNHAVVVVGYGQTEDGEKFWIVRNSWGAGWGESGYFRILRGTDELGIESIAVEAEPIPW